MEKRISDLLDCIQDDTVQLRAKDIASSERIKELTMKKINGGGRAVYKRRSKLLSGFVAAAALALALTGVALATNAFGVADYFRDFFGGLDDKQAEVLEEIGTAALSPVTSNGTTMTPLAAFADEDYLYLALKIEAPSGVVLSPNTQGTEPGPDGGYYQFFNTDDPDGRFEIVFDESKYKNTGYQPTWVWQDDEPGDNVITCIIRVTAQSSGDLKWNDGIPKTIHIPGLWSQSPDKEYTKILSGIWEFEINGFGVIDPIAPEVEGLVTYFYFEKVEGVIYKVEGEEGLYESDEYKMTLKYMTVSPLGIKYSYTCAYSEDIYMGPGVFRAVMKDGRKVELMQSDSSWTPNADGQTMTADGHGSFTEPIILDDVDYIQFGGLKIPA